MKRLIISGILLPVLCAHLMAQQGQTPVEQSNTNRFTFGVIGDVQVDNTVELGYAVRSLFTELQHPKPWSFALFMGDLVNDNTDLFPPMVNQLDRLPFPYRNVFGNHDRTIADNQPRTADFDQHFSTSTYAFTKGKTHFLVLNNIVPKGKYGYEGFYNEEQRRFVADELRSMPKDRLVIIAQHIPLMQTKNPEALTDLLQGRRVLMLSGHTHTVARYQHPLKDGFLHELVAGAACGSWWTGEKDVFGIPAALMSCGSPRNYFEVEVADTSFRLTFKGIGLDTGHQMHVWVAGHDTIDKQVADLDTVPGGTVLATIYAGFDQTAVWMQLDDEAPVRMNHVKRVAPLVARVAAFNKSNVYPTKHSTRLPLRSRPSNHVWQAQVPLNKKWHRIRIFAEDACGFKADGYYLFE